MSTHRTSDPGKRFLGDQFGLGMGTIGLTETGNKPMTTAQFQAELQALQATEARIIAQFDAVDAKAQQALKNLTAQLRNVRGW
jgi:hypothetical protein